MNVVTYSAFSQEARFRDLSESVQHCSLCPRLCGRRKVLSPANGTVATHVVFVAEAPGRLGADRTGIPLHGDRTGDNFEALLGNIGWERRSVFVTNAVLCNPRNEEGNNGTPTAEEVANCSSYLRMVLALVQPAVVVTLGATALKAVDMIVPHGRALAESVATAIPWAGRILFPLYHPGPRALVHRSLAKQRGDFIRLAKVVDPLHGLRVLAKTKRAPTRLAFVGPPTPLQQMIVALVQAAGPMSLFKLTKLLYLADLRSIQRLHRSITGEVYLRQAAGPWPPQLKRDISILDGFEIQTFPRRGGLVISRGLSPRFDVDMPDERINIVMDVVAQYGCATDSAIKTAAYLTAPMKYVLREERKGRRMINVAVLYRDTVLTGSTGQLE